MGTQGKSYGSWDDKKGCYTGGIYTGAKTSANHEIWERYLLITSKAFEKQYNKAFQFYTWSYPGNAHSPFLYEKNGYHYYDEDNHILVNYLARFKSSITGNYRSWNECLSEAGYMIAHDSIFPSRLDGQYRCMMSNQLIYNAALSRPNALLYRTDSTVNYDEISTVYSQDFFDENSRKSKAEQMYESETSFYKCIEKIRQDTSNGIIHGEIIDSSDTYSERVFLEELLDYCNKAGIKVVTKKEAYDYCFNNVNDSGNIVYNPNLENTVKMIMPNVDNMPENPDGYTGDCKVEYGEPNILIVNGMANYLHCGIPLGKMSYGAECEGEGTISIFAIKNSDDIELKNEDLILLNKVSIDNDNYESIDEEFTIEDKALTEYEQLCAGWGDKIMGIKVVFEGNLKLKNIEIRKVK